MRENLKKVRQRFISMTKIYIIRTTIRLCFGLKMPDVLVCANDMMAIGAIRKFQENGIRIPDDIAVCGFDDIIISRYLGLTAVSVPDYERGFLSCQALINIIDGNGSIETTYIGSRVKRRKTT